MSVSGDKIFPGRGVGGGSKNHCPTRCVLFPHPSSVLDPLLKIAPTTTSQPVPANFCRRSYQHLTFL